MYRSRYAMMGLSVALADGTVIPTGHLHGSLTTIAQLSTLAPKVLLAVDSRSNRFDIYPEYKGNRDKKDEFPIKKHTMLILAAATALPNVHFIKKPGFEADDLINHIIANGDAPTIFGTDNDLMQSHKPFRMSSFISGTELECLDLGKYIREKYSIELDFLPVWYKVVRGDRSDNLPAAVPRYPSRLLTKLCVALQEETKFEALAEYVKSSQDRKLFDAMDLLQRNYQVVSPRPVYIEDGAIMEMKVHGFPAGQQLLNFQMAQVIQLYQSHYGVHFL